METVADFTFLGSTNTADGDCSHEIKRRLLFGRRARTSLDSILKKNKIMASIPSNSWQIEGEKVDAMTDFIFLVSKITADGDCSHEIKRRLLLGRKL